MADALAKRSDVPPELVRKWDLNADPEAAVCPYRAAAKLHSGPPVFFNAANEDIRSGPLEGSWVVTRYELAKEVLRNEDIFSTHMNTGFSKLLGEDLPAAPLELEPIEHAKYRMLLNPLFSPKRVDALAGDIRQAAVDLIEGFRVRGQCEFLEAFGSPLPSGVFMRLMGLPLEEKDIFLKWEAALLRGKSFQEKADAARSIKNYMADLLEARRRKPADDLVSFLVQSRIDDKPIPDERALGICCLFFMAGFDTTAALLGFAFRELAMRPELQQEIRKNPDTIADAVDEFVRAFGVVTAFRYLARDCDFHGVRMAKGDSIMVLTGFPSRDPDEYENPHLVDFHRPNMRNITFGAGKHRCIASHLARKELRIALEEWSRRIGEFRLKPDERVALHTTSPWGVEHMVLEW